MELLRNAEAAANASTEPTLSPDMIHRAKGILDDLAVSNASPRRIARLLGVPYHQLLHAFKLSTGVSPHHYRLEAVIRRAKELLENTDLSVKAVAAMLRFSDQYYFAKFFKRKTGITPSDWRAQAHRQNSPRANPRA
jgi:AraC-like DNA-binding protein